MQIDQKSYRMMLFMSKQVGLPKISLILQKMKISPKPIYALFAQSPSIIKKSMAFLCDQKSKYNRILIFILVFFVL